MKGIIVEALQCLKCLYHNDLIFREVITALEEKLGMEKEELLDSAMDAGVDSARRRTRNFHGIA